MYTVVVHRSKQDGLLSSVQFETQVFYFPLYMSEGKKITFRFVWQEGKRKSCGKNAACKVPTLNLSIVNIPPCVFKSHLKKEQQKEPRNKSS